MRIWKRVHFACFSTAMSIAMSLEELKVCIFHYYIMSGRFIAVRNGPENTGPYQLTRRTIF